MNGECVLNVSCAARAEGICAADKLAPPTGGFTECMVIGSRLCPEHVP